MREGVAFDVWDRAGGVGVDVDGDARTAFADGWGRGREGENGEEGELGMFCQLHCFCGWGGCFGGVVWRVDKDEVPLQNAS